MGVTSVCRNCGHKIFYSDEDSESSDRGKWIHGTPGSTMVLCGGRDGRKAEPKEPVTSFYIQRTVSDPEYHI